MGNREISPDFTIEDDTIYVYTAVSPEGKVYIGISYDPILRMKRHKSDSRNTNTDAFNSKFKRAIRKYRDKLKWSVIDTAVDYETAHELERRYILHFDSYVSGYNMTTGGDGYSKNKFAPTKWNKESILAEARKYNHRPDWNRYSRNSYLAAKRFNEEYEGFMSECTAHMSPNKRRKPKNLKWTRDKVVEKAREYSSLNEFKNNSNGAYSAMHDMKNNGDEEIYCLCTSHMNYSHSKWSRKSLSEEVSKYKSKSEWERMSNSSYEFARKILKKREPDTYESITKHMRPKKHGRRKRVS